MQINFNPSINYSRPNFKASFSDDIDTKILLKNFNRSNDGRINLLATHYALQDMASNDKISLVEDCSRNTIYAKNLANGKEILLNGYHRHRDAEKLTTELRDAVEKGFLINEKPKLDMNTYTEQAVDFLYATTKKDDSIASKLEKQIKKLEDKLKNLKDNLQTVNHNSSHNKAKAVEREIFSLAKK